MNRDMEGLRQTKKLINLDDGGKSMPKMKQEQNYPPVRRLMLEK